MVPIYHLSWFCGSRAIPPSPPHTQMPPDNYPCKFPRDNCPQDNSPPPPTITLWTITPWTTATPDNYLLDNYPPDDCLRQLPPRKLPLRTIVPGQLPPPPPPRQQPHRTVAPTRMFMPSYAYKEISLFLFSKLSFLLRF